MFQGYSFQSRYVTVIQFSETATFTFWVKASSKSWPFCQRMGSTVSWKDFLEGSTELYLVLKVLHNY